MSTAVLQGVSKTSNEFKGMTMYEVAFQNDPTPYFTWRSDEYPISFQPGDTVNFEVTGEDKKNPSKKKIKFLKSPGATSGNYTPASSAGGATKTFSPPAQNNKQDYILYNVVRRVALEKLPEGYRNLDSVKSYTETVFNGIKEYIGTKDTQFAINTQACLKDAAMLDELKSADPQVLVSVTKTLVEEMDSYINQKPVEAPKASIPTSFLDNLPKSL